FQAVPNSLFGAHVSEDENSLQRIIFQNPSGRVDTIELRHADVQNQQVRFELPAFLHGLATIRGLTANFPPFMRSQQVKQTKAQAYFCLDTRKRSGFGQRESSTGSWPVSSVRRRHRVG